MPIRRLFSRPSLLVCGLLFMLVAVPVALTWREWRQEKLDQALVSAVGQYNSAATLDLLRRGANSDACKGMGQSISLWQEWKAWQERLGGTMPVAHRGTPVLLLAVTNLPSPYGDKAGYARGVAVVKALLDHGAQVTVNNEEGVPLLSLAVEAAYDTQIVRLLLQPHAHVSRASLDAKNPLNGRTPLMAAAGWGEPDMLNLLLGAGANIDTQGKGGWTALMFAVNKERDENVACLLAHRANIRIKDSSGETVLSMARVSRTTSFTHEAGADFWPRLVRMIEQADTKNYVETIKPSR